jgi:hypothetical protein
MAGYPLVSLQMEILLLKWYSYYLQVQIIIKQRSIKTCFVFQKLPLFIPEMPAGFTSYCSDYPHLFRLDPVTTAVWLVSVSLIILSLPSSGILMNTKEENVSETGSVSVLRWGVRVTYYVESDRKS